MSFPLPGSAELCQHASWQGGRTIEVEVGEGATCKLLKKAIEDKEGIAMEGMTILTTSKQAIDISTHFICHRVIIATAVRAVQNAHPPCPPSPLFLLPNDFVGWYMCRLKFPTPTMQSVDDSCKLSQLGITSATKGAALILITPPGEQQKGKGAPGHDHGALRQRERPQVRFQPRAHLRRC